jgi:hypothetical protein
LLLDMGGARHAAARARQARDTAPPTTTTTTTPQANTAATFFHFFFQVPTDHAGTWQHMLGGAPLTAQHRAAFGALDPAAMLNFQGAAGGGGNPLATLTQGAGQGDGALITPRCGHAAARAGVQLYYCRRAKAILECKRIVQYRSTVL